MKCTSIKYRKSHAFENLWKVTLELLKYCKDITRSSKILQKIWWEVLNCLAIFLVLVSGCSSISCNTASLLSVVLILCLRQSIFSRSTSFHKTTKKIGIGSPIRNSNNSPLLNSIKLFCVRIGCCVLIMINFSIIRPKKSYFKRAYPVNKFGNRKQRRTLN